MWIKRKLTLTLRKVYNRTKHYYARCKYGVSFEDEISLDDHIARILIHSLPKYKSDGRYGQNIRHLLPKDWLYDAEKHRFQQTWTPSHEEARVVWEKAAVKRWNEYVDAIVEPLKDRYIHFKIDKEAERRTKYAWRKFARQAQSFWW